MSHIAPRFVAILPLLLLSACASSPPPVRVESPATRPSDGLELLHKQQDLNLTKSTLTLKNNRLKETLAQLQAELNKQGVTTSPGQTSPREYEIRSLVEQLQKTRGEFDDAKARLHVLEEARARGEFPSEVDEGVSKNPAANAGELRTKLSAAMQKKLKEQSDIAEFKIRALQQRLDDLKSVAGELDYKMFEFYRNKAEQEAVDQQLDEINRRIVEYELLARSGAR